MVYVLTWLQCENITKIVGFIVGSRNYYGHSNFFNEKLFRISVENFAR